MNSDGVSETGLPSTATSSRTRSILIAADRPHELLVGGLVERAAAQQRGHAADQLGGRERLRDVVVGAELEPAQQVALGVLRGEHDDRHVAPGADLPARLLARELRQHQVEDHEVDRLVERGVDGGLAVGRDLDLELVALERVREAADERRLVVDDEDAWAHRWSPFVAVVSGVPSEPEMEGSARPVRQRVR